MSKKSMKFLENSSLRTKQNYASTIKQYEAFHGTDIDSLVGEALDEQTERVAPHQLKVIDRIEDFQNHLINKDMVHGTISVMMGRIKTTYRKNRVELPYITPINPKKTRRREYIEYEDVLTKDELKCALKHMNVIAQARTLTIAQGGLSNAECELLTTRAFIDETKKYHNKEDDIDALKWLADENHPIIWVTKLVRQKTKKPYYALIGAEAVNKIAEAKLYEKQLPRFKGTIPDKLLSGNAQAFGVTCRNTNNKCGLGKVAEESKLRPHNLRRFNATHIKGSVLTYEESLTNAQIDEMQGRGKTSVQDTYIKTDKMTQKLLYAKVMNNVSLYHHYDYVIVDGDVEVFIVDPNDENQKLKRENEILQNELEKKQRNSAKLNALKDELGDEVFLELVQGILNPS